MRKNRPAVTVTGAAGATADEHDRSADLLEPWLATNRRAYFIICAVAAVLFVAGTAMLARHGFGDANTWWAGCLSIVGLSAGLTAFWASRRPRIAYDECGEVVLFINKGQPARIPIDVVECFFLGQGPSGVQNRSATAVEDELECRNIVVRLAERAVDWQHGPTNRRLAGWCDGYITLVGTWCEPISADLLGRLNHQLAEAKRQRKGANGTDSKNAEPIA